MSADNPCIQHVHSLDELVCTPFRGAVNALCWQRSLRGDFAEVLRLLNPGPGITHLEDEHLLSLPLSPAGQEAASCMLADLRMLRELGLDPVLDAINGYIARGEPGLLRTDVCSFHADSADDMADTWLCTYHGAASEGLRSEDAVRHVDMPETRARLLQHYGGADDEGFLDFLAEHYYDLHYAARPGALPYSFGVGNLWRIAIEYPGSPVLPCVHRAPDPVPGHQRLLLIS